MKNSNENKWALVTGASGGVGKEIAKILAGKGWNLVLVARSESKLVDLSKELVESNSINVKTFSIDLTPMVVFMPFDTILSLSLKVKDKCGYIKNMGDDKKSSPYLSEKSESVASKNEAQK